MHVCSVASKNAALSHMHIVFDQIGHAYSRSGRASAEYNMSEILGLTRPLVALICLSMPIVLIALIEIESKCASHLKLFCSLKLDAQVGISVYTT